MDYDYAETLNEIMYSVFVDHIVRNKNLQQLRALLTNNYQPRGYLLGFGPTFCYSKFMIKINGQLAQCSPAINCNSGQDCSKTLVHLRQYLVEVCP